MCVLRVCVRFAVCVCVCVRERQRKKERESVCEQEKVKTRKSLDTREYATECEGARKRETPHACEKVCVCVCERERERE